MKMERKRKSEKKRRKKQIIDTPTAHKWKHSTQPYRDIVVSISARHWVRFKWDWSSVAKSSSTTTKTNDSERKKMYTISENKRLLFYKCNKKAAKPQPFLHYAIYIIIIFFVVAFMKSMSTKGNSSVFFFCGARDLVCAHKI